MRVAVSASASRADRTKTRHDEAEEEAVKKVEGYVHLIAAACEIGGPDTNGGLRSLSYCSCMTWLCEWAVVPRSSGIGSFYCCCVRFIRSCRL